MLSNSLEDGSINEKAGNKPFYTPFPQASSFI
jgi:hypothetical protein